MTGYGRFGQTLHDKDITIELKAVNHRYFEYNSRIPRNLQFLDTTLKKMVQEKVSRGKVELSLTINSTGAENNSVEINHKLAKEYLKEMQKMSRHLKIKDDIKASHFIGLPDIFTVTKTQENEEQLTSDVVAVAEKAIANFIEMRVTEGGQMATDILSRANTVYNNTQQIKERSPQTVAEYHARLEAKLSDILSPYSVEQPRILTEVAIIAEKLAVDEETVRLESHLSQLNDIINKGGTVGRQLDFLLQELNREINTIGSKSQDTTLAKIVIDTKSELEKIREQVQNIE